MKDPMGSCVSAVIVLNLASLVLFVLLWLLIPIYTDFQVRLKFVELDRAGVVNPDALRKFDPSYGFDTQTLGYRNTLPRYLAGPALLAERINAGVGLVVAVCNVVVSSGAWLWCRYRRRAPLGADTERNDLAKQ